MIFLLIIIHMSLHKKKVNRPGRKRINNQVTWHCARHISNTHIGKDSDNTHIIRVYGAANMTEEHGRKF